MKNVKYLIVKAGNRYWEDGEVNGIEDSQGDLIPFREGDYWCPIIELETGTVLRWPKDKVARVHYKVCDDGEYWLADKDLKVIYEWSGYYVPDDLLCVGDTGYGDYIVLNISADGKISGWKNPSLNPEKWRKAK